MTSEDVMSGFATRLAEVMVQKGMGVRELYKASGISRSSIYRYLNAKSVPKLDDLERIAEALDVSRHNLLIYESV